MCSTGESRAALHHLHDETYLYRIMEAEGEITLYMSGVGLRSSVSRQATTDGRQ